MVNLVELVRKYRGDVLFWHGMIILMIWSTLSLIYYHSSKHTNHEDEIWFVLSMLCQIITFILYTMISYTKTEIYKNFVFYESILVVIWFVAIALFEIGLSQFITSGISIMIGLNLCMLNLFMIVIVVLPTLCLADTEYYRYHPSKCKRCDTALKLYINSQHLFNHTFIINSCENCVASSPV
jgi:hypothetical protein